jgi:hypothetical protein
MVAGLEKVAGKDKVAGLPAANPSCAASAAAGLLAGLRAPTPAASAVAAAVPGSCRKDVGDPSSKNPRDVAGGASFWLGSPVSGMSSSPHAKAECLPLAVAKPEQHQHQVVDAGLRCSRLASFDQQASKRLRSAGWPVGPGLPCSLADLPRSAPGCGADRQASWKRVAADVGSRRCAQAPISFPRYTQLGSPWAGQWNASAWWPSAPTLLDSKTSFLDLVGARSLPASTIPTHTHAGITRQDSASGLAGRCVPSTVLWWWRASPASVTLAGSSREPQYHVGVLASPLTIVPGRQLSCPRPRVLNL